MDETPLYQRIAESIRRQILEGSLRPGDFLPTIRKMTAQWRCTPGTVQRAYRELANQGLIVGQVGKGTQVAMQVDLAGYPPPAPLRRAQLLHKAEAFLLEILAAGYEADELSRAMELALERWRVLEAAPQRVETHTIRFFGSHDPLVNWLANHINQVTEQAGLQAHFVGSLGGLIALSEGRADLAGCHLWDVDSGEYNRPFIHKLLPGKKVLLARLADRRLGLLTAPGNPHKLTALTDLVRPGLRFVNRQSGSGTRVWLDASLARLEIPARMVNGYEIEKTSDHAVAQALIDGQADVGVGLESAALAYGLNFVFLVREPYDLVTFPKLAERQPVHALLAWLGSPEARLVIAGLGGYDTEFSGQIELI